MLVEDSKNITLSVRICLEAAGYQVSAAEDGVTALEEIFKAPPDLVLLDLLIPKMNGMLVLKAIRENPLTKGLPVIIISAKSQNSDIQSAYKTGANDYLIKPFTPNLLLSHVKTYYRKERLVNEDTSR